LTDEIDAALSVRRRLAVKLIIGTASLFPPLPALMESAQAQEARVVQTDAESSQANAQTSAAERSGAHIQESSLGQDAGPATQASDPAGAAGDGKAEAPDPAPTEGRTQPATQATASSEADGQSAAPHHASVYGPPAPRVEHGELPQISWPAAPATFPPALANAIRIATHNYPTATGARDALKAADADVRSARWQRFPSVGVSVGYGAPNSVLNSNHSVEPQLTVQVPLWTGGEIKASIHKARASEDVASQQYVETVQTLALKTAKTYFEIVQAARHEELLYASLQAHQSLVATMERRVAQQVSPQVDLDLARSRTAQIQEQYTLARAQRLSAIRALTEVVGDPNFAIGPVPKFDPAQKLSNLVQLGAEANAFDPTIRRLLAEADVARAELAITRASVWPRILGQFSYDSVYHSQVGIVAQIQSGAGLSNVSQREAASLKVSAAGEKVRQEQEALSREIDTDIISYENARARAAISVGAMQTAQQVSESYVRQFISGHRTWLDVMNALREYLTAQLDQADAEVTAMDAADQLELLSGRWQPSFNDGAR